MDAEGNAVTTEGGPASLLRIRPIRDYLNGSKLFVVKSTPDATQRRKDGDFHGAAASLPQFYGLSQKSDLGRI